MIFENKGPKTFYSQLSVSELVDYILHLAVALPRR